MKSKKRLIRFLNLAGVLATSACASTPFPYTRYALQQNGDLLASSPKNDRRIEDCRTDKGGSQCFVFFADQYSKMRKDYAEAQRKLKSCK